MKKYDVIVIGTGAANIVTREFDTCNKRKPL